MAQELVPGGMDWHLAKLAQRDKNLAIDVRQGMVPKPSRLEFPCALGWRSFSSRHQTRTHTHTHTHTHTRIPTLPSSAISLIPWESLVRALNPALSSCYSANTGKGFFQGGGLSFQHHSQENSKHTSSGQKQQQPQCKGKCWIGAQSLA